MATVAVVGSLITDLHCADPATARAEREPPRVPTAHFSWSSGRTTTSFRTTSRALEPHQAHLDALLVDFEIPAVTARATVDLGHAYGVPVIVDAAPPRPYGSKVWGAGTILSSNRLELSTQHVPTFSVPVVDTTGAGDAFMGGLTVAVA